MRSGSNGRLRAGAAVLLFVALGLFSCSSPKNLGVVARNDLFSLGMGPGEGQINIAGPSYGALDVDMRGGIFEVADSTGGRIMRFSSYGDLLSMLYDPSKTLAPIILKPVDPQAAGKNETVSVGRYAAPTRFLSLGPIATDSSQVVYAVDRLSDPNQRVFDKNSSAWCDRVIRRFGKMGAESPYIGQEGVGGTPFPFIEDLQVLADDSLVVTSASESTYLIHRFDRSGNLMSMLKMPRGSLPVPKELQASIQTGRSTRVDSSVDAIVAYLQDKQFEIAIKIDYYVSTIDPSTKAVVDEEFKGSWVSVLEGSTGHILNILRIDSRDSPQSMQQLIGKSRNRYFLLENQPDGFIVSQMDNSGRTRSRLRIVYPRGVEELLSIKLTPDGYLHAALLMKDSVNFVWWNFG